MFGGKLMRSVDGASIVDVGTEPSVFVNVAVLYFSLFSGVLLAINMNGHTLTLDYISYPLMV